MSFSPTSTCVNFSLSAFGCFIHDLTFPTTKPFNPPLYCSYSVIPSTSKPISVSISAISVLLRSILIKSLSQLRDIFI